MKTSEYLELGRKYTRSQLKKSFDIEDETIKTGIFKPKGHSSIWLFITKGSHPEYDDDIIGAQLKFSGQVAHKSDNSIIQHYDKDLELIVFYRDVSHGPFTYCGRAQYVAHEERTRKPTQFTGRLIDMEYDTATGNFRVIDPQSVVKEKVRFVADTHLIRVLGEQLIASVHYRTLSALRVKATGSSSSFSNR